MNLKKIVAAVSLLLLAGCVLCACRASEAQTAAEPALPELKIGTDILEPFFYVNENGDYTGIDAEIATEACRRAGYTPKFVEIDWSGRDTYLNKGTVDCLWAAFIKNGREESYHWTETYLQSDLRMLVSVNDPDQDIQSMFTHGSVAVRVGSKAEEIFLKNEGGLKPVRVYSCGSFELAETAFVKGYVGALCCHEAVLEQVMSRYPGLYRFLDGSILSSDLGVAFAKDDTSEAWQKINDALVSMKEDGTISAIVTSYRSERLNREEVSAHAQA